LLSIGGSTVERSEITVTTGWSNTKTAEASVSVTASVGGSYGAANFSLSATVGFSYTDSTSLSKETAVKQKYNFRPGYITTYYQWGVQVKDHTVLNGQVKIEAKSIAELQELKAKIQTQATVVKITLQKVVPPAGEFEIKSVPSGLKLMCHSEGRGNCKMELTQSKYMTLTAEKVDENLYRFKNKESGYYLEADGGRGNVRMSNRASDNQIFRLCPTGTNNFFKLASYTFDDYFMHSDNTGTGNLWMTNYHDRDPKGRLMRFAEKKKSYF